MKSTPLKVGDKVRVVGFGMDCQSGMAITLKEKLYFPVELNSADYVEVKYNDDRQATFHRRQVTHVKRKKERRRIWVDINGHAGGGWPLVADIENPGFTEFVEVRKKK